MKPLLLGDIARVVGAPYAGPDLPIDHICDDSRKLTPGCLFVALTGDNFDGHSFIGKALEEGAAFVVSHKPYPDPRVLLVTDTREALLAIAGLYRKRINPKVAAVTGSVGKTTTKEMTACVLGSRWKTLKTPANLNNEVGLSHTILMLEEDHGAAVLELGVDGPGQMAPLALCAAPDVGILTVVGDSHLANYGSREGILREKLDLRAGLQDGAPLLLSADNDVLEGFADPRLRVLRYGIQNPADFRATAIAEENNGSRFDIAWEGHTYPVRLPALGRHNIYNALAGFAAGVLLGLDPRQAAAALEEYRPEGMRQKLVDCGDFTVVEDCYNAGPASMRAALATLTGMACSGRRIAVLSDMLELGEDEAQRHREIGRLAASSGIDLLLATGALSRQYVLGAREAGLAQAYHYPNQKALLEGILSFSPGGGDILWFKASHGMHLENLFPPFYQGFPGKAPAD